MRWLAVSLALGVAVAVPVEPVEAGPRGSSGRGSVGRGVTGRGHGYDAGRGVYRSGSTSKPAPGIPRDASPGPGSRPDGGRSATGARSQPRITGVAPGAVPAAGSRQRRTAPRPRSGATALRYPPCEYEVVYDGSARYHRCADGRWYTRLHGGGLAFIEIEPPTGLGPAPAKPPG